MTDQPARGANAAPVRRVLHPTIAGVGLAALVLSALPALPASAAEAVTIFVATTGDDTAAGTSTTAPVKTLARAQELVREALPDGGWPETALTELLLPADGIGELRLLWPTLARLSRTDGMIALVAPPYLPFAQAWANAGVQLNRLQVIRTDPPAPAVAGVHGEVLPAWSVARNWTSVVPSRPAVTAEVDCREVNR